MSDEVIDYERTLVMARESIAAVKLRKAAMQERYDFAGANLRRWEGDIARLPYPGEMTSSFLAPGSLTAPVGKKAAGRLLDGREWNEFPEVRG